MPESTTVGQRFTQLIQQLGLTKNSFAQSLGKTATVIQHIVEERNKPGFDLLCKVVEVYPNVSLRWLMLAEPPMLHTSATNSPVALGFTTDTVPTSDGIDLREVLTAPRRRNGTLLQPADIAATLALATKSTDSPAAAAAVASPPAAPLAPAPAGTAPTPATPAAIIPTAPAAPEASYLAAALQAQSLQHQLALAEQRNQHLLEQQQLLQQMVQLLQRTS